MNDASRIVIGHPLAQLPQAFKRLAAPGTKVMIIADAAVAGTFGRTLRAGLEGAGFRALLAKVASGEKSKNFSQAERLHRMLARVRFERGSWLMALGGGVVGDLTGFVAATFLRGIAFVQVPTTLLAQVDASIGGKTGVDIPEGKNLVGAFYMPKLVWIDPSLLKTLPAAQWRNGLAEVIKYGAIRDARLFAELERRVGLLSRGFSSAWVPIIRRCAGIKAQVVRKDPYETTGWRAILNFGHTIGHAIEAAAAFRGYLHGEAISIGMCAAASIAQRMGFLPPTERMRLRNLLVKAGLPIRVKKPLSRNKVMEYLSRDKKVRGGNTQFVLLKSIGRALSGQPVKSEQVESALCTVGM